MQTSKRANAILIAAFLAAISLPLLAQLAGSAAGTEQNEKRKLAPLPRVPRSLAEVWKFPEKFVAYYGDHFGLRAKLIRLHALLVYKGLGMSPSDKVLAGGDGWFYYADDYSLEDYRSLKPFSTVEMEKWRTVMEERQTWLQQHGAKLLIVFACDKYVIYPENLPAGYRRREGPYRVDELADYLKKNSKLSIVALRPALEAGKAADRLYHKTDTHWNDRGAYIGYREILQALTMKPQALEAFRAVNTVGKGWDLARMMGLDDVISEENRALEPGAAHRAKVVQQDRPDALWNNGRVTLEVDDPALPRMVMFRDSFGSALVPFLGEHFRRSVFLWQYDFDPQMVLQEKPDVVIWLMTSRRLQWFDPVNPPLP